MSLSGTRPLTAEFTLVRVDVSHAVEGQTEVSVKFPNATYVGDTVSGEFGITETSEDAPFESVGTVGIKGKLTNQNGALVCLTEAEFLVDRE